MNAQIQLDPRPEYARAQISCWHGEFLAEITDNQVYMKTIRNNCH